MSSPKKVAIILGSDSDLPVAKKTAAVLKELEIPFEIHVYSAHRTPDAARDFARGAREAGFGVMIAAAAKARGWRRALAVSKPVSCRAV